MNERSLFARNLSTMAQSKNTSENTDTSTPNSWRLEFKRREVAQEKCVATVLTEMWHRRHRRRMPGHLLLGKPELS